MGEVSFSYQQFGIEIGHLESTSFSEILKSYSNSKIAILTDDNTHKHCLDFLITGFQGLNSAEIIVVPALEESKELDICVYILETLSEAGFGRKDLLINLGGGMITDLGGFVASIYKRGMPFIQIPTSLLAMVDASIGSKTGINFMGLKNQIGTFSSARNTYIDKKWLQTLPTCQWNNGFAEILKHALIADAKFWTTLMEIGNLKEQLNDSVIQKAIDIKCEIVGQDPKELGLRKILNFGHTIGHALESYYFNSKMPLSHGHAVAIGILIESEISLIKLGLPKIEFEQIKKVILKNYLLQIPDDYLAIWQLMQHDKKNDLGKVKMSLLTRIGSCAFDQIVDLEEFKMAFEKSAELMC